MTLQTQSDLSDIVSPPDAVELADMLHAMGAAFICTDMDHRLTAVSPRWAAMVGVPYERCVGARLSELVADPVLSREDMATLGALARGEVAQARLELRLRLEGGDTVIHELVSQARRGSDGRQIGWLTTVTDITAQRQAEQQLRQSQKLESVGRLAAGIAHEINTPIQFIGDNLHFLSESFERVTELLGRYRAALDGSAGHMSWSERLEMLSSAEAQADLDFVVEEVPEAVDAALGGVQRVASIVRAMKAFGHPDRAEGQPVDINEVIRNTLVVARNEMKYVAEVSATYGPLPPVVGHPSDLGQVFLNLFVNAADAVREVVGDSGQLGTIEVTTALVDGDVVIAVTDTGAGIPEGVADHIFDPFFTTKEVGTGTGQGLSLSRAIVERHNGSIRFDPAPGGGTRFVVALPLGSAPGTDPAGVAAVGTPD